MDLKFSLLFVTILCLNLFQAIENAILSNEAVLECGNIHHIELHNFPQANASFSNGKCRLTCWIGNTILATDSIYEGRSCPEDSTGICRNGQCIDGQEDALHECGQKHNLDFSKMKNHKGTAFTNDQCMLKCVLDGTELSVNPKHEGSSCPGNSNGVCRSGTCVTQSTSPGTITPSPTTVTKPSIDSFSASKIKFLNISLESADPPLDKEQYIRLNFYQTNIHRESSLICEFYGNPIQTSFCNSQELADIIKSLMVNSQMTINLHQYIRAGVKQLTGHFEDLFPLLAKFYQNHNLPFGEKENFVSKFVLHRSDGQMEKLIEVGLRFTLVFSN